MTRVKICGITNVEDARAAVDYGAHALGFVLFKESPRYVYGDGTGHLNYLLTSVPPLVSCVAVASPHVDLTALADVTFSALQMHETPTERFVKRCDELRLIYAFRMQSTVSLEYVDTVLHSKVYRIGGILLDAYHSDKLGGSGETFDWELAREAKERFGLPIILAGGLTPENVGDAIAAVRPYAVDVSSGVESEPGRKDHAKLKAFIRAVHKADAALES